MVFPLAQKNGIFLSHMVANALTHRPALNWWGGLSWNQAKRYPKAINLKHNAIVPIVDLARVYALAEGLPVSNTYDRLVAADHNVAVSRASAHDLRDTLAYLGKLRIKHQGAHPVNATLAGDLGAPPHIVSVILGHSNVGGQLVASYNHSTYGSEHQQILQDVANKLEAIESEANNG